MKATALGVGMCLTLAGPAFADTEQCIASAEHGQQLRGEGRLGEARESFLACQQVACPEAIVKDCTRWLDEVERVRPSIVVLAKDPDSHEVVEVSVSIDGTRVAQRLDGRAMQLDPGRHVLRVEWSKGPPTTTELLAREGDKDRLVDVKLERFAAAPVPRSSRPVGPWIMGGAGLAMMGVGGVFWGVGLTERASLYDACGVSRVCTDADKSSAQTKLVVGDVAFFLGVAAVVSATIWLLTARGD